MAPSAWWPHARVAGPIVALAFSLVVIPACALPFAGAASPAATATATSVPAATPTATATPTPTCANSLADAGPVRLGASFNHPIAFPAGTVGTVPIVTASGTGLFTVRQVSLCTPASSISAVKSFYATQLRPTPYEWLRQPRFPGDGGMMVACASSCWLNPQGGAPLLYMALDTFVQHGTAVTTYRLRWAVSPPFPVCGPGFASPAADGLTYFLPDISPTIALPPVSTTIGDDASNARGFQICSPGTVASVTAFMLKELPANGWSATTSSRCVFNAECWGSGSAVMSWQVTDPLSWVIAWYIS